MGDDGGMSTRSDDLGTPFTGPEVVTRVVSLVPSLTESIAATRPEALVAATDWCTHPADLDVPRVRGTKNPDLAAIAALQPELVVCNKEENRELDVRRLREKGIAVWVTVTESVPQALDSLHRLFTEALGWDVPAWLTTASHAWSHPVPEVHTRAGPRPSPAIWSDASASRTCSPTTRTATHTPTQTRSMLPNPMWSYYPMSPTPSLRMTGRRHSRCPPGS